MHKAKGTPKKFLHLEAQASHLFAQRERTKQLSKSFGDLPNLKKEIDEKLKGKLPKPSPRSLGTRRLGETNVSLEIDDIETSLVTRDCSCVLQLAIMRNYSSLENTPAPPPSRECQRLKDIARENTKSANPYTMRQRTLKVDDIVQTASKLEAEYLMRAKSPAYSRSCTHRGPYGNRSVCEKICNSDKSKPSSRLKKRTLVVKIPGLSDNLNDYNCKGGRGSGTNFFLST